MSTINVRHRIIWRSIGKETTCGVPSLENSSASEFVAFAFHGTENILWKFLGSSPAQQNWSKTHEAPWPTCSNFSIGAEEWRRRRKCKKETIKVSLSLAQWLLKLAYFSFCYSTYWANWVPPILEILLHFHSNAYCFKKKLVSFSTIFFLKKILKFIFGFVNMEFVWGT